MDRSYISTPTLRCFAAPGPELYGVAISTNPQWTERVFHRKQFQWLESHYMVPNIIHIVYKSEWYYNNNINIIIVCLLQFDWALPLFCSRLSFWGQKGCTCQWMRSRICLNSSCKTTTTSSGTWVKSLEAKSETKSHTITRVVIIAQFGSYVLPPWYIAPTPRQ
jgi:hypothetical protein